jgi:effector-binding domain-containing protein
VDQEPHIQDRAAQDYAGIKETVTMETIGGAIGGRLSELFGWLTANGIEPAGAPFVRFLVIDMMSDLRIEVGVPVSESVTGDGNVQPGVLPAGKYAVIRHVGPYDGDDGLIPSNAALQEWAKKQGIEFDMRETPEGDAFAARFEQYLTDPSQEPDSSKWVTDTAYLTRDQTHRPV